MLNFVMIEAWKVFFWSQGFKKNKSLYLSKKMIFLRTKGRRTCGQEDAAHDQEG